jgi:hypothetical protein
MVIDRDLSHEEEGGDTDEGQRFGEGDTDVHEHLELSSELGLTRNALDGLADDDANADTGADGCQAIADGSDVSTDFGES